MNKFIDWQKLEFKKTSGREKLRCPNCDEVRTDKTDKSLVIYHNDGVGKCFYCEALTFSDSGETNYSEKQYNIPSQSWKNYTQLSDKLIKWVEESRKISQSALIDLGITEELFYQPKHKKEINNIVFNYFEGEKLVNKKYRSPDKSFTQTQGGKPIFYNINSVIGQDEVYIVEGEFDVLALRSHGIKNAISVPNGANDNDEYWKNSEKYLKDIQKFIIAVDNDEKGKALKEKIAQRLGRWRCDYINWSEKDANGSLIAKKIDFDLSNRKKFPVSGTFTSLDLRDGIFDLYNNGLPETIYPKNSCFGNFKEIFSMMRGQLTVVTGIPSHGKSSFAEWLSLNLINDYDSKLSMFSPEHSPMPLHQTTLIQKAVGKPFWKEIDGRARITPNDIERYINWSKEKIYITSPDKNDAPTWDWIFEKFKEQMFAFGIDIFIIDAFNKVLLPSGNKKDSIDEVLTRLTAFAQQNNVSVCLVAHPTKMQKDEKGNTRIPNLYDVSGSADFRNQTHNGYAIHRFFESENQEPFTRFVNLKTKFQFQGEIGGNIDFLYDLPTGRFYAKGQPIPTFDMTLSDEVVEQSEIKSLSPNEDFDWINEPSKEINF
jgi:twinkle protein